MTKRTPNETEAKSDEYVLRKKVIGVEENNQISKMYARTITNLTHVTI